MASNPSDKAVFAALSKPEDKKLFDKALATIKTQTISDAFRDAHQLVATTIDERIVDHARAFVQARLIRTAEYLFTKNISFFCGLQASELIACAASSKCFNEWIGKDQPATERRSDLMALALEKTMESVSSALGLWFIEVCPTAQLKDAAPLILASLKSKPFSPTSALLSAGLRRDSEGEFAGNVLLAASSASGALSRIADDCYSSSELLELMIPPLAKAAGTLPAEVVAEFASAVFGRSSSPSSEAEQRRWSAVVLALASVAMRCSDSPGIRGLLKKLDELSKRYANGPNICGIRFAAGGVGASEGIKLTESGARLLVLAFEHLEKGEDPFLTLESTAMNLGMKQIAEAGELTEFDPHRQEDTVGGLIRGEPAKIVSSGWELNGCVIERAKVIPV